MNTGELFSFIDGISAENKHSLLLYEDYGYAQVMQFRFILNGLQRNQHCVYTTHDGDQAVPRIEKAMRDNGIDVDDAKRKKLLHIYSISSPTYDDNDGLIEGFPKILSRLTADSKPPYVIVSTLNPHIDRQEGVHASIYCEKETHEEYSATRGSLICSYDLTKLKPQSEDHQNWFNQILLNHHNCIFVKRDGTGVGLKLR